MHSAFVVPTVARVPHRASRRSSRSAGLLECLLERLKFDYEAVRVCMSAQGSRRKVRTAVM